MLLVDLFFKLFYVGIITDSKERGIESVQGGPAHPSPSLPSGTFCLVTLIIAQCQNQEIDMGTIHRVYSEFTSYICMHACV